MSPNEAIESNLQQLEHTHDDEIQDLTAVH